MDLTTAYDILGVPKTASLDEVKACYRKRAKQLHPDTSQTTDPKPFILLTAAYTLITESLAASSEWTKEVSTDILDASHIDEQIYTSFSMIQKRYEAFQKRKVASAKEQIRSLISVAGSSWDLRTIVERNIKDIWIELVVEIESYVDDLYRRATTDDREFLFSLFNDLYTARRRYWLSTVYRNPFLLASFVPPLVCAMLPNPPIIALTMPWVLFIPLVLCLVALVMQYQRLNPRRQFVPPRLSLVGIQTALNAAAKNIGIDRTTATSGGAVSGAIIGTVIAPGVGTLVGAGVGALLGLFMGENLDSIKERVEAHILGELDAGIQQLDDRILAWLEQQRARFVKAARESFTANIQQVGKLLTHRGFTKQLTSEAPLLLSAPTASDGASSASKAPREQIKSSPKQINPIRVGLGVLLLAGSFAFTVMQVWQFNQQYVPPKLVVHTATAIIRSGPAPHFSVLGTAHQNETFLQKGRAGEWYEITYANQPAWIRTSAVHEQEDRVSELDTGGR